MNDQAPASPTLPALLNSAPPPGMECTELGMLVEVRAQLEARGVYDASRLRARKPELFQVIARLLASGVCGKDEIARLCGVAWETVAAVEAAAASDIRDFKRVLSGRLRLAISAAADKLIDQARAGDLDAIAFGILVDKLLLIEGEATARVELVEDPATAAFRAAMAALASQAAAGGAPGMGLVGGNPGKGAALGAGAGMPAGPLVEVDVVPVPVRPSDLQAHNQP